MEEKQSIYKENLKRLLENSETREIDDNSKIVIFSDLHMGDKSSTDDFKGNSSLFRKALEYYLNKEFHLILNGDVEEMQRFSFGAIERSWPEIFALFSTFNDNNRLTKLIGNHDLHLVSKTNYPYELHDSLLLKYGGDSIFIFHGHQASKKYSSNNDLVGFTLKYLANPLGIKNFSVAHNSRKQYKIEKRVYSFSNEHKIISIIGHTHRPLFESLSKGHRLKHKIEQLCRELSNGTEKWNKKLLTSIKNYKRELEDLYRENEGKPLLDSLYNEIFHIPSVFNSGTTIGKRGITCLEIDRGKISLIHWFDGSTNRKYLRNTGYLPAEINQQGIFRMVINEEDLNYIFTRIKVLT